MTLPFIIAGRVPAILLVTTQKDARDKPGHDDGWVREMHDATPIGPVIPAKAGIQLFHSYALNHSGTLACAGVTP
jgi:hypothetical protein